MNLPNRLTVVRLLLIPVFLIVATMKYQYSDYAAAAVFFTGAVTDGLDGYLARKNRQETLFGNFMDPLADKILVSAALIILVEIGRLSGWMAAVIISREFAVTGLRAVAAAEGINITASVLGKIKTVTQIIAILILFTGNYPFTHLRIPLGTLTMAVAVAFTVWSGMDYYFKTWRLLKKTGY